MFSYIWPMALVVISNIFYNIASKSLPRECSPFAALIITYLTASVMSLFGFLFIEGQKNVIDAIHRVNWVGIVLGISMVGLEIGFIYIYRSGWKISLASLVAHILLAVALLIIGVFAYKESISLRQIIGILLCIFGVLLITKHN